MTTQKQRKRAKLRKKGEAISVIGNNGERRRRTFNKESWNGKPELPAPTPKRTRRKKKDEEFPSDFYGRYW